MVTPRLYISRTPDGDGFPLPSYETQYHVGLRLMAGIGEPIKINTEERLLIPIGFAIGIPQGFCGQIVSYSPLAEQHGVIVVDAPHIINPADREPIFVNVQNISKNQFVLHRGDVIAELVITPVVQVCWNEIQHHTSGSKTDENDMILEETVEENKTGMFNSLRRKKSNPRNRFGAPVDD